jgi:hypothetical protein
MGVEGVGGHAEVVGQATHGQGAGAVLVEQGEGLLDDEVAREEASRLGPGRAGGHLRRSSILRLTSGRCPVTFLYCVQNIVQQRASSCDQRREDEHERDHDR